MTARDCRVVSSRLSGSWRRSMRSSPVALTGSTGSKTRTENVDIGRDTGAGRRETEKRKKEGRFRQEREQTTRRLALAYGRYAKDNKRVRVLIIIDGDTRTGG
jgi:hypothetical protein